MEIEEQFHDAIAKLEVVTHELKPPDAWREFDPVAVEDFWRAWPDIRAWGQWLWELVDKERGEKAVPVGQDPDDYEEIGGG